MRARDQSSIFSICPDYGLLELNSSRPFLCALGVVLERELIGRENIAAKPHVYYMLGGIHILILKLVSQAKLASCQFNAR